MIPLHAKVRLTQSGAEQFPDLAGRIGTVERTEGWYVVKFEGRGQGVGEGVGGD